MNTRRYAAAVLAAVLMSFSTAHAQVLLQWNTYGNTGSETTEPSVFNSTYVTATNLTLGAGVNRTQTPATTDRFGGTNWTNTLAGAISGDHYIEFIVTPTAGSSFTPTQFVFKWQVNNITAGPSILALRSSADSFGANLATGSVSNANITTLTFDISGLADLTTATTFRLYGYGGTSVLTSAGFDNSGNNSVDVQLNGTGGVASAIPEPSTYAAILGGVVLMGTFISRRRRA